MCKIIIALIGPLILLNGSIGMLGVASVGKLTAIAAELGGPDVYGYVFALYESAIALSFILGE